MKYPAYPEYKSARVYWISEIPKHWNTAAIKRKFRIVNGSTPKSGEPLFWDGDIQWVTPADYRHNNNGYISDTKRKITIEGLHSCGTTLVPENSIILTTRAPIGAVALAENEMCSNQGCKALVVDSDELWERYIYYTLSVSVEQLNALGLGTTFMELSKDDLGYYPVAIPSFNEQKKIAAFLDYKTKQIDQLIKKKKTLIDKLNEQRIAVITKAVTKGLEINTKMKSSGVDWLGDVPEHWEVKRIKFSFKDKAGAIKTGPFGSQLKSVDMKGVDYKVFNQKNVIQQDLSLGKEYIDEDKFQQLSAFEVFEYDLLITTRGTIGKCMEVPKNSEKGILHPCLMRLQLKEDVFLNDYFVWLLQESGLLLEQLKLSSNATTLEVIYSETLKNITTPLPPLDEQLSIVKHLKQEMKHIDAMIMKISAAIERLNEYRNAIITDAVTGKIDVRNVEIGEVA